MNSNTLVYTTKNIMNRVSPVDVVCHDEDGDWQALSNLSTSDDEPAMITIQNLLDIDSSIENILDMPKCYKAIKQDSKWDIVKDG